MGAVTSYSRWQENIQHPDRRETRETVCLWLNREDSKNWAVTARSFFVSFFQMFWEKKINLSVAQKKIQNAQILYKTQYFKGPKHEIMIKLMSIFITCGVWGLVCASRRVLLLYLWHRFVIWYVLYTLIRDTHCDKVWSWEFFHYRIAGGVAGKLPRRSRRAGWCLIFQNMLSVIRSKYSFRHRHVGY